MDYYSAILDPIYPFTKRAHHYTSLDLACLENI